MLLKPTVGCGREGKRPEAQPDTWETAEGGTHSKRARAQQPHSTDLELHLQLWQCCYKGEDSHAREPKP